VLPVVDLTAKKALIPMLADGAWSAGHEDQSFRLDVVRARTGLKSILACVSTRYQRQHRRAELREFTAFPEGAWNVALRMARRGGEREALDVAVLPRTTRSVRSARLPIPNAWARP
jgi:hypothetical protein